MKMIKRHLKNIFLNNRIRFIKKHTDGIDYHYEIPSSDSEVKNIIFNVAF